MTQLISEETIAILGLIEASACEDVRLEVGDLRLHVRRSPAHRAPAVEGAGPGDDDAPASEQSAEMVPPVGAPITSPMVGTFYRAPAPGAPAFVELGDQVTAETVLCIIEAMKVMSTLKAGEAGTILEIAAMDGDLVEYGQRLFTIDVATS